MTEHVSDRVIDRALLWRPGRGGVRAITCWIAECAECGSEWAEDHNADHGGVPHFAPADVSRYLLDPDHFGFRRTPDGRVLCRGCARVAACAAAGHEYTPWHAIPGEPGVELRYCENCGSDFQERHTATDAGGPVGRW
jgi:hypothetical protein